MDAEEKRNDKTRGDQFVDALISDLVRVAIEEEYKYVDLAEKYGDERKSHIAKDEGNSENKIKRPR